MHISDQTNFQVHFTNYKPYHITTSYVTDEDLFLKKFHGLDIDSSTQMTATVMRELWCELLLTMSKTDLSG